MIQRLIKFFIKKYQGCHGGDCHGHNKKTKDVK